jgi:hypothetical protein
VTTMTLALLALERFPAKTGDWGSKSHSGCWRSLAQAAVGPRRQTDHGCCLPHENEISHLQGSLCNLPHV